MLKPPLRTVSVLTASFSSLNPIENEDECEVMR